MGFEVNYSFHERVDGGYNKEETKSFKKKVGDPFEEVPLEKLAGAIMAQLARRDVWIVTVEVVELSRKPISFRETDGGIVLKNRKFTFDGAVENISSVIVSVPEVQKAEIAVRSPDEQPHNRPGNRRPIDSVIFAPEPHLIAKIKQKGLRLTVDKKYQVFEKKPGLMGDTLLVVDDLGKDITVSDEFFIPGRVVLLGDDQLGFTKGKGEDNNLNWGGASREPDMPDIRRK